MFSNSSCSAITDPSNLSMTEGLFGKRRDRMVARATTGSYRDVLVCNVLLLVSWSCELNVPLYRDDDIGVTCDLAGSASELVRLKDIGIYEEWPAKTNVTNLDQIEAIQSRMLYRTLLEGARTGTITK